MTKPIRFTQEAGGADGQHPRSGDSFVAVGRAAAKGEPFIIAKAGKPMVKVAPLEAPETGEVRRFDFMAGQIQVPDDFDRMGGEEIEKLFGVAP